MRVLRLAGASALAVLVIGVPLSWGCGGDAFTAGPPGGEDAGAADGPTADAGDDGPMPSDASDGPTSPQGKTVYVSASNGDDSRDGLDKSHPKKTIASALGEASHLGAGAEVHVCAGTYVESGLQLDFDVGLYGGWDCASWQRSAGYGFPKFDPSSATIVQFAPSGTQQSTLSVTGSVTSATTIDGFQFQGASSAAQTSVGVDVAGSAAPVLSNDLVTGGAGKATPTMQRGSVGLRILDSAAPEVKNCAIDGGSGTGATGSIGIFVSTKGASKIHGDVVFGGKGTSAGASTSSGLGSVGVDIESTMTGTNALALSTIDGSGTAGANGSSAGVVVGGNGVSADIVDCNVAGGVGSASGTASAAIAVNAPGGTINVSNDRLWGGERGESSQTFGVLGQAAARLVVVDTEIHAGSTVPGSGGPVGVYLAGVSSSAIAFDTIYSGATSGATGVKLVQGAAGVAIEDDLFFGGGAGQGDAAVAAATCAGQVAALGHTGFVNFDTLYLCGSTPPLTATAPTAIGPLVGSGVDTTNDVEVESASSGCASGSASCIQDQSCPSSPPASCVQSVLGDSWTANDDGVSGLYGSTVADAGVTTPAWEIASPGACKLTGGGTPVSGITTDLLGKTRDGSHPTMGAVEYTGGPCAN